MSVVSDWFGDLANSVSDSLSNTTVDIWKELVKGSYPSPEQLSDPVYLVGLGGGLGLANRLVLLVIVVLGIIMILTPMNNHGLKINRLMQSIVQVGVYGFLFFPVYTLFYDLVQGAMQALANLALGEENSSLNSAAEAMMNVIWPEDIWFKLIVASAGLLLAYGAFVLAWANFYIVVLLAIFYTVPLALRSLGEKANAFYHATNSAVLTSLATPVVIVFGLLLPAMAERFVPGAGATGVGAGIFTVLGGIISFLGPFAVAFLAFKGSQSVFGKVEASISGNIGIDSLPPVTTRDMNDSVKEGAMKAFVSSVVPGAAAASLASSDDLLGDIKKLAVEGASAAAAATGHPVVAGVLNAVDTTLSKEKRAHAAQNPAVNLPPGSVPNQGVPPQGGAPMPPPTGDPVA